MTCRDLFGVFYRRIAGINYTLRNVTAAYTSGDLVRRDLAHVYEGLFLQAVVSFELLTEQLFIHLLAGGVTHARSCRPLVRFPTSGTAQKIVTRDRYEDWIPYSKLKDMSDVYFKATGNPFADCPSSHRQEIDRACHIRNYIAHKSDHSKKVFLACVVAPTVLPLGQRDLLGYFRYPHTASTSKFAYHLGELVNAARWFCGC